MNKRNFLILALVFSFVMTMLSGCSTQVPEPAADTIEVTDCAGRTVSIPADPRSVSCVCPFSGAYIVMFGAGDAITTACNNMTRSLLLASICPSVADALVVKSSGSINAEEILEQDTDLLVVNGELYADPDERQNAYLILKFPVVLKREPRSNLRRGDLHLSAI